MENTITFQETMELHDLKKKCKVLESENLKLHERLSNGRHYLMGISLNKFKVEDALEHFGYDSSGFDKYEY